MKAAMQRLRQTAEGKREAGRQAKGDGLPFWPWSAWVGHGSSGAEHRKGGPPRHQALLPGSWKAQGLSAHSALPVIAGLGEGQRSHFSQSLFLSKGHSLKRTDVSSWFWQDLKECRISTPKGAGF